MAERIPASPQQKPAEAGGDRAVEALQVEVAHLEAALGKQQGDPALKELAAQASIRAIQEGSRPGGNLELQLNCLALVALVDPSRKTDLDMALRSLPKGAYTFTS